MKYRITSDRHIGHRAIVDRFYRPKDHVDKMIKGLKRIGEEDTLICLGDILFTNIINLSFLNDFKFKKILIKGNHDKHSMSSYNKYFDFVCEELILNTNGLRISLSHRPKFNVDDWDFNIHGHFHDIDLTHCMEEFPYQKYTTKHKLYSPEIQKYIPMELINMCYTDNKKLISGRSKYYNH